jgi:dual specificity phosphatase 12
VAVVAALVMSAKGLPRDAALELVAAKVPGAAPNPGFVEQLGLWGDMGCQLDEGHPGYKRFLLEQVGEVQGWMTGREWWWCLEKACGMDRRE